MSNLRKLTWTITVERCDVGEAEVDLDHVAEWLIATGRGDSLEDLAAYDLQAYLHEHESVIDVSLGDDREAEWSDLDTVNGDPIVP